MPSPGGGTNPDHYMYVSNKFQIKPGAKITDDLFVGPGLGVGLQVRDFAQLLRCVVLHGLAKPSEGQQLSQINFPLSRMHIMSLSKLAVGGSVSVTRCTGTPRPQQSAESHLQTQLGWHSRNDAHGA